jgi:predicted dehydrogenase
MSFTSHLSRRSFIRTGAAAFAGASIVGCQTPIRSPRRLSANEKLNIALIGTANRAGQNMNGVSQENIVALCDIDGEFLAAAKQRFPAARTYNDFRKMLEQPNIDAVVVSTADHCHAVATAAALHLGKHVYCEKPLTHTVFEARHISKLAARYPKLATQMGIQIHANENYHRTVEMVKDGAIGKVTECHVWCEKSLRNSERPVGMPPIPKSVHWDLWLGPASARPYHPDYLPKTWRHWWDFGEGILGDMACHYMDLAFWALDLKHPLTIEAEGPPIHQETTPEWLVLRYEFPGHGSARLPVTWYDGGKQPALVQQGKVPDWRNAVLFVGEKGMLIADYTRRQLLPDWKSPVTEASSRDRGNPHHKEWITACKTGVRTSCNFQYGGRLTEAVLLGNVAYRTGFKLDWDAAALRASNAPQASNFLHTEYRRGWEL